MYILFAFVKERFILDYLTKHITKLHFLPLTKSPTKMKKFTDAFSNSTISKFCRISRRKVNKKKMAYLWNKYFFSTAANIKSCGPFILKIIQQYSSLAATLPHYLYFNGSFHDDETKSQLAADMTVIENFITEEEEKKLLDEIEPYMKNLKYEQNHWDGAIEGYRETERLKWNEDNSKIINRVRELAFGKGTQPLRYVHILDLKENGVIKPHIDSVRFCGTTIAGISLLSDSVMRLQHDKDKSKILDIFLKRRSLYVMAGVARYEYTHEILGNEDSKFGDVEVKKTRRISVICRNEP